MARIAGVNLQDHKHTVIALQSIFGIGENPGGEDLRDLFGESGGEAWQPQRG